MKETKGIQDKSKNIKIIVYLNRTTIDLQKCRIIVEPLTSSRAVCANKEKKLLRKN